MERLIHLQIQEDSTGDSGSKKEEETTKNRKDSLKGKKAARNNLQDFYVFFQLVPLSH